MKKLFISRFFNFCLLICFISLAYIQGYSQDIRTSRKTSYYTYIFRLTDKEARKIYNKNLQTVNESFFHTLADSFPTDSTYRKILPNGHYLYMLTKSNKVEFKLVSKSNIDVKILNNSTDLVIFLSDPNGEIVSDADVRINNRSIRYDSLTHSYVLKKSNAKGFLTVKHDGLTSFYSITREKNNSAFRRTTRKILYQTPVKYVATPVVLTISLPKDIYKLATRGQRRGWIYFLTQPFYDISQSIYWGIPQGLIAKIAKVFENSKETKGYLAFNKNIYRPGDTVLWKAYILNERNHPLKRKMFLTLSDYNFNNLLRLGEVECKSPGVYLGKFALNDSMNLNIDKNYILNLSNGVHIISNTFRLEDYELKNTTYQLSALKNIHYASASPNFLVQVIYKI